MTTLERNVQALLEMKLLHRSVDGQLRLATDALAPYAQSRRNRPGV
jgi:hypothetical protein